MIQHNIPEAIRQEYELAREGYDRLFVTRNIFNHDHNDRYHAARERLNRAKDMMWKAGEW